MSQTYTGVTIADFNADTFGGYLRNDAQQPTVDTVDTPFGQVMQLLMDPQHDVWQHQPDFAVVWTQPQGVIESFNGVLAYDSVPEETLLAEVDQFAAMILTMSQRVKYVFVPTWVLPTYQRGLGLLDLRANMGMKRALMTMNLRLAQALAAADNIYMLDAERWTAAAGKNAFNPKLWYMAKSAFGNSVYKLAVAEIKAALTALSGGMKKLIVLDLDNTLWGGVVGDVGYENLKLGGHDAVGEAFVHFQRTLKALAKRGILLAVASKNTEAVALEAINNHPEMVLRQDDFVAWRINWQDKAQNIADMVAELNLGLQSVVFIDDNPVERARVCDALPEVFVPDWPEDRLLYTQTLLSLTCFDTPTLSAEDAQRTQMYLTERKREALKQSVGSVDEWLATLGITIEVEPLTDDNKPRTVQLFNKTNQMNLTTRRLSESDLLAWAAGDNRAFWTFRVSDKYGEQGLTAIASVELRDGDAYIVDYLLSCRVMGRKVEETLVAVAVEYAQANGAGRVIAQYQQTAKNQPCLDFWKRSGFAYDDSAEDVSTLVFTWDASQDYPLPSQVTIQRADVTASPAGN